MVKYISTLEGTTPVTAQEPLTPPGDSSVLSSSTDALYMPPEVEALQLLTEAERSTDLFSKNDEKRYELGFFTYCFGTTLC